MPLLLLYICGFHKYIWLDMTLLQLYQCLIKRMERIRNAHAYDNAKYDRPLNELLSHWIMTNLLWDQ